MKKLSSLNLGKGVKREEMKAIQGGYMNKPYVCTCSNGTTEEVQSKQYCSFQCY
jgi:natural product precursor